MEKGRIWKHIFIYVVLTGPHFIAFLSFYSAHGNIKSTIRLDGTCGAWMNDLTVTVLKNR